MNRPYAVRCVLLCFFVISCLSSAVWSREPEAGTAGNSIVYRVSYYSYFDSLDIGNAPGNILESLLGEGTVLSFYPNNPDYLGLDIAYRGFGIKTFVEIADNYAYDTDTYGASSGTLFHLYYLGRRHCFEGYYHRTRGYYAEDSDSDFTGIVRGDLQLTNIGAYYYFIFNPDRFSIRAAFNQSERQLHSGGSFSVLVNPNYGSIQADGSLIDDPYLSEFDQTTDFTSGRFFSLTASLGYFYTFNYRGLFITPSLFLGFGPQYRIYEDLGRKAEFGWVPTEFAKIAVGYNGERYYGGMDITATGIDLSLTNIYVYNFFSYIRLYFGSRF